MRLFRCKSITDDASGPADRQLRRVLGPWHLTALGVGAIVGAGIFTSIGSAAAGGAGHPGAGPALVFSLVLVAIACGFAALCYAEWAAMVPSAGSAYTYAYATLGELAAWLVGWDLILEYAIGNVAVAISWSAYFQDLLRTCHLAWPVWLGTDYRSASAAAAAVAECLARQGNVADLGASVLRDAQALAVAPRWLGLPVIFNLPAVAVVGGLTWVLVLGIRESARFNTSLVFFKLAIVVFFIVLGATYIRPENWTPFAPHGFEGISAAAAIVFFAYIGFDAVSTASEESRNPQRDLPFSILASLGICTVLYVAVAAVLTGMVPWQKLGTAEPLALAFAEVGLPWAAAVVSVGALLANTTVLAAFQIGQPRIFFAMARDGLLPRWAAKVHPRYRTPHVTTILTGVFVAVFASFTNINEMVELTNIGTLFAFILVAIGVLILRKTQPDRPRPFRVPCVILVALATVASCGYLMTELPAVTWLRFAAWMAVGLLIYLAYGLWRHWTSPAPPSAAVEPPR